MGPLLHFWGVVEVEDGPINCSLRKRGRGGIEVRYSIYFRDLYHILGAWQRWRSIAIILVGGRVVEVC